MNTKVIYKSKFLDCWPALKEVRRSLTKGMWTAHERDEFVIWGGISSFTAFLGGFGRYYCSGGLGPNFSTIVNNPELLRQCMRATEAVGFSSEMCGTLRVALGSILSDYFDKSLRTGQTVTPDFYWDNNQCQSQIKCMQVWAEYYPDIPYFTIEMPTTYEQSEYLVSQMHELVEIMGKKINRKYDDELLIQAVKNEWESRVLWGKIIELQKTIPAPLDARWIRSFQSVATRGGMHDPDVVNCFRLLYEETKDRVENGIAALSTERCRLMHEGMSTWYPSQILQYPNSYGAIYINSGLTAGGRPSWVVKADHSFEVGPTIEELGLEMKTRDDAFRSMALLYLKYCQGPSTFHLYENKVARTVKVAQDWHLDGFVLNNSRECRGFSGANDETALALKEQGIAAMIYEGAPANPEDLNIEKYMSHMDAFLESFGLKPLGEVPSILPPDYNEF